MDRAARTRRLRSFLVMEVQRIGFCAIFAAEIVRKMNWKQLIILMTAMLFNAFVYGAVVHYPAQRETGAGNGTALTVDRSSACASCERGNCSFSNGCSCACSILNIKDFHKFVNFRPALDSALVCGFHAYEVVAEHALRMGGTLSQLMRLNL